MIKDLVLLPRLLYSVCFVLLGMFTAFTSPSDPKAFIGSFVLVFGLSFVWQYFVLHFGLKPLTVKSRRVTIALVMVFASVVIFWSLYGLASFDWAQNKDLNTLLNDFGWTMGTYLSTSGLFVGGACTRRAFKQYNAL